MKPIRGIVMGAVLSACLGTATPVVLGQQPLDSLHPPRLSPTPPPTRAPPSPVAPASAPAPDQRDQLPAQLPLPETQGGPVPPENDVLPPRIDNVPDSPFDRGAGTGKQEPAVSIEWIGPPTA